MRVPRSSVAGVLLGLPLHDLAHYGHVLLELPRTDDSGLLLDQVGKGFLDLQLVHHPQGAADHEPGKVAFPHIGGDDAVAEHISKAAGVVHDRVHLLDGRDHLVQFLGRDIDRCRDFLPEVEEVRPRDVHEACILRIQGKELGVLLVVQHVGEPCCPHHAAHHLREDRVIDRGRSLGCPDQPLETIAGVHDPEFHGVVHLAFQLVARSLGLLPAQAHEDEGGDLEAADQDLDARPGIAAADPRVLLVGDPV